MSLVLLKKEIRSTSNQQKAKLLQRYFKTGPGEYGEGDIFLGLTVPQSRRIAHRYSNLALEDVEKLIQSKFHEERFIALEILVFKYEKLKNEREKEKIVNFYLKNTIWINNWDLVDTSAPYILGDFFYNKKREVLYKLVKSSNIWERRLAIISTFYFIKNKQFNDSINISELLLQDKHDLIQKAVGWMLREIGKKDKSVLEEFLEKHYKNMPRTTLRYAIEKFPEKQRKAYLNGEI